MTEYIEREAAYPLAKKICDAVDSQPRVLLPRTILDLIDDLPAADVRPVVRCRDCEYCRKADEFEYWCDGFCSPARLVRKDDFCSHGKAKE